MLSSARYVADVLNQLVGTGGPGSGSLLGELKQVGKRVSVAVRKSIMRRSMYSSAERTYTNWDDIRLVLKRFTWLPGAETMEDMPP